MNSCLASVAITPSNTGVNVATFSRQIDKDVSWFT